MHLTMHVQTGGGAFRFPHVWAGHLVTSFREKEKDYVFTPEHILRRSVPKLRQESLLKNTLYIARESLNAIGMGYCTFEQKLEWMEWSGVEWSGVEWMGGWIRYPFDCYDYQSSANENDVW